MELVAPLVGAWIEIHPIQNIINGITVAPLVGAWIEIISTPGNIRILWCRSPRGSVD